MGSKLLQWPLDCYLINLDTYLCLENSLFRLSHEYWVFGLMASNKPKYPNWFLHYKNPFCTINMLPICYSKIVLHYSTLSHYLTLMWNFSHIHTYNWPLVILTRNTSPQVESPLIARNYIFDDVHTDK